MARCEVQRKTRYPGDNPRGARKQRGEGCLLPMSNEDLPLSTKHSDLPFYVREFLDQLRPEEIKRISDFSRLGKGDFDELQAALELYHSLRLLSKLFRWVIMGGLAMLIAFMTFADQFQKIFKWFRGGA